MSAANQHLTICVLQAMLKCHCSMLTYHGCCGDAHPRFGSEVAHSWRTYLQGPRCMLLLRSFRRNMGRRQMCGAQAWWHTCCCVHACPGRETSPSPHQISTFPWVMARASIERCSLIWHQMGHKPLSHTMQNPESEVSATFTCWFTVLRLIWGQDYTHSIKYAIGLINSVN